MEGKSYQWQPEDSITITGAQFSALYNGVNSFMHSPVGTPHAMLGVADAQIVLAGIVEEMIEAGIAKEIPDKQKYQGKLQGAPEEQPTDIN